MASFLPQNRSSTHPYGSHHLNQHHSQSRNTSSSHTSATCPYMSNQSNSSNNFPQNDLNLWQVNNLASSTVPPATASLTQSNSSRYISQNEVNNQQSTPAASSLVSCSSSQNNNSSCSNESPQNSNYVYTNSRMHNNFTRLWLDQQNRLEAQRRNQMLRRMQMEPIGFSQSQGSNSPVIQASVSISAGNK